MHLVIHIIRVLLRDTCPGGPDPNPSQWTFMAKTFVYIVQTLIGVRDGVFIYRCYSVWHSKLVVILPVLLWCGLAVTGIASPYLATHAMLYNGTLATDHRFLGDGIDNQSVCPKAA